MLGESPGSVVDGMSPAKDRPDIHFEDSARTPMLDPSATFDPEAYAAAVAPLLGLSLDPRWMDSVTANLRVLAKAAELVSDFPLADEVEAAPSFEA
jgi:hypothetical protein